MAGLNLALPFLIINMGGEMIYILNQRLIAQKIPADKSEKVRSDVVKHLFEESFINEIMVPQALYSMTSTRQVFDRIAQSSIMKLQTTSMNKLFDLMLMGVKMQLLTAQYPEQLLKITLNHIQELTALVTSKDATMLLNFTREMMIKKYSNLSSAVYNRIRQALLRFFQNRNVKVTMFLNNGMQLQDGTIKINSSDGMPGCEIPGRITTNRGDSHKTLPATSRFKRSTVATRQPMQAQTNNGINLYDTERQNQVPAEEIKVEKNLGNNTEKNREAVAKWELNSLANMIYTTNEGEAANAYINLFNEVDVEIKEQSVAEVTSVLQNTHIDKLVSSLDAIGPSSKNTDDDELLDLL